mgnify:CR=1 FL=1|tara:strand:- start:5334 stop:6668 length:1335 start_codon:yes stop_codon:yes gene_type:complete
MNSICALPGSGSSWRISKVIKSLMVMMALVSSLLMSSAAMAQDDGGGGGFGLPGLDDIEYFFVGENTESFDARRQGARALLDSYDCVACEIFDEFSSAVFNGMSRVDAEGPSLIPVVVGFAQVFALFYLGSAFVSGDASDLTGRWQVFWRLCLAVAAASAVLAAPVTIMWDYVYSLLFSIGTGVVNIVGGAGTGCTSGSSISVSGVPDGARYALENMSTTVCGAYEMTLDGIANGMAIMTQKSGVVNTLAYIFTGMFVVLIYGFLAITFPLRFIDVVIRLAIVSIVTPILIVCLVFKPTRGYFSIAVSNVLNATAQFAILSIIFRIGSQVFTTMTDKVIAAAAETDLEFTEVIVQGLVLIGVAVVFNGIVKSVPAIAAEFSRSSGGGMDAGGNAAVGMVGRAATIVVSGAGAGVGVAAMRGRAMAGAARGAAAGSQTGRGVTQS